MKRTKITDELVNDVINYYKSRPMSYKDVCDKFGICPPTVGKILKDTPKYLKAEIFSPELNERFFEHIDNEASAYYLGLIISDGNVFRSSEGRQDSISITLDEEDMYLLQTFKDLTGGNCAIAKDGRGCRQFAIRSNLMANDLAKYGVVPRKSFHTYLPKISDEMMPHLIRGIFDGDGCARAGDWHGKFYHSLGFCGTHELMSDIVEYTYRNWGLKRKPLVYDYKDRPLSEFKVISYYDTWLFGERMYENATIYMKRKKEKYEETIKHGNAEITKQIAKGCLVS